MKTIKITDEQFDAFKEIMLQVYDNMHFTYKQRKFASAIVFVLRHGLSIDKKETIDVSEHEED